MDCIYDSQIKQQHLMNIVSYIGGPYDAAWFSAIQSAVAPLQSGFNLNPSMDK